MTALDQSMMRAAMALRLEGKLDQWLSRSDRRSCYECRNRDEYTVMLCEGTREIAVSTRPDRLDAKAQALAVAMLLDGEAP